MIHSFVVHLVVNDLVGDELIGVVEDVSMADRHHFRTADGLVAHLLHSARLRQDKSQPLSRRLHMTQFGRQLRHPGTTL